MSDGAARCNSALLCASTQPILSFCQALKGPPKIAALRSVRALRGLHKLNGRFTRANNVASHAVRTHHRDF
jgi:hypothetical protein